MVEKISDWYHKVSISPDSELVKRRNTFIEELASELEILEILDAIKIFFGYEIKSSDYVDKFLAKIKEDDLTFSKESNSLEIRLLSGILIYYLIFHSDNHNNILIAISTINTFFKSEKYEPLIKGIITEINGFIYQKSVENRQLTEFTFKEKKKGGLDFKEIPTNEWEPINNYFQQTKENFNWILERCNKLAKSFENNINSLKEENNILWWSYNGYSTKLNNQLALFSRNKIALIIAQEIADLTLIIPGPYSIEGLILKAMSNSAGDDEESLGELINLTEKNWRINLIAGIKDKFVSVHTPILLAIKNSTMTDNENDWYSFYEKETSIIASKKYLIKDISLQFYNEMLFIKSISELEDE